MVNWGYRAARLQGKYNRWRYYQKIQRQQSPLQQKQSVPAWVYAFSCERDLPEQVASIRSFLTYVGIPERFTVLSDGSYTNRSCTFLKSIHSCVKVIDYTQFILPDLPSEVYQYAEFHPLGKKIAVLLSLPYNPVNIYIDSDILFFPLAQKLVSLVKENSTSVYYLLDAAPTLDNRLIKTSVEQENPANSGFLIAKQPLDWSLAIKRFLSLKESPSYFTEQTMLHLTVYAHQAIPLDVNQFVVNRDDEFIYADRHAGDRIILRHYVSPIRHKFWCNWQYLK
ncbi:MAG: hypothetical protein ACLFT0_03555 [Spirulinaceae cyanobacterium]